MKSKTSTATNVTANFQNNNIKKSKNSATNLFHRGGILYSIPKWRKTPVNYQEIYTTIWYSTYLTLITATYSQLTFLCTCMLSILCLSDCCTSWPSIPKHIIVLYKCYVRKYTRPTLTCSKMLHINSTSRDKLICH